MLVGVLLTWIGLDQWSPLSVERITAWNCVRADGCTPDPFKRLKMSTSVPFGWTAIWFPIEKTFARGAKIGCAVSQVSPPSVVRANQMSPRNANEWRALKLRFSPGLRLRSQTA